MDIKKIYEMPMSSSVSKATKPSSFSCDTVAMPKKTECSKDTVNISAEASFKSMLNNEVKKHSVNASDFSQVSTTRINNLKEAYSNDKCPVSSMDIARAMTKSVCGYTI